MNSTVFGADSIAVEHGLQCEARAEVSKCLFVAAEVERVPKSLNKSAAVPDRLKVCDVKRLPRDILVHILNNSLSFGTIPLEMRLARTVFIPKCASPKGPGDFRPVTVSPVLYRVYAKMILFGLFQENRFHKFQSGFQDDKSTSSDILVLQALMRLLK